MNLVMAAALMHSRDTIANHKSIPMISHYLLINRAAAADAPVPDLTIAASPYVTCCGVSMQRRRSALRAASAVA